MTSLKKNPEALAGARRVNGILDIYKTEPTILHKENPTLFYLVNRYRLTPPMARVVFDLGGFGGVR